MARAGRVWAAALLAAAALAASARAYAGEPASGAPRIVAIADIHGAYESFVALLTAAELVDAKLDWAGGDTRLVIVGDVLDRGAGSRAALELIMRLQSAAARRGGQVHFVLGNHEVMNLIGDLAYVADEEYAAYAADESAAERAAAWLRFREASGRTGEEALAAAFAEAYPPGFFGHRAAFATDGPFGRWLLDKPVLLVIDGTAFVHGGLPEAAAGLTAEKINRDHARALREYLDSVATLIAAQVLHPEDPLPERAAIAARFVEAADAAGAAIAGPIRQAADRIAVLGDSVIFDSEAPYWYRGTVSCSAAIERDRVSRALRTLGASRLIVGHTPTPSARVLSRFDRTVIRADTGMLRSYFGGQPAAVVIRGADLSVLYADSAEATLVEAQAGGITAAVARVSDELLEDWLANGSIAARTAHADGTQTLRLERNGATIDAVFRPAQQDRGGDFNMPEVAAYRLDRLLDLDLVPATVRRDVDSRPGSVQLDLGRWPDERQRVEQRQGGSAWCPLSDQFNLLYVFDILIHHDGRAAADVRYIPGSWQLALTGNERSFGTQTERPGYLRTSQVRLSEHLAGKLRALNAEVLEAEVGDVLDERRRRAILARRDQLLDERSRD